MAGIADKAAGAAAPALAGIPWLTIIVVVVSFFLAGGAKKEDRAKAALIAAGVGAATYGVTHYTDWGKENLGALDGLEITNDNGQTGVTSNGKSKAVSEASRTADSVTKSGNGGLWQTLSSWLTSPAGQVTTGAAGAKAVGAPNWLVWGGLALGAYLLLK